MSDGSDDFGATAIDREAIDFSDWSTPEVSAPTEAPPEEPAAPREVSGPAWAGTLTGLEASSAPTPPPPVVPAPVVAPTPVAPEPTPAAPDPEDFAATTLHKRAYALDDLPPVDDLARHRKILREAGAVQKGGSIAVPGDTWLTAALVVLVALIALVVLALVVGTAIQLMAEGDEATQIEP